MVTMFSDCYIQKEAQEKIRPFFNLFNFEELTHFITKARACLCSLTRSKDKAKQLR